MKPDDDNWINTRLPRKVKLSEDGRKIFWLAILVIAGGVVYAITIHHISTNQIAQRQVLKSEGKYGVGEVISLDHSRSGVFVHYTFQVEDLNYQGSAEMPDRHVGLSVGSQIPIRYLPSDPSVSHPSEWEWSAQGDIMPDILMLFFSGLSTVMLVILYRRRRLARKGWVVEGRVTGCVRSRAKFRVYYEFRDGAGTLTEGSSEVDEECDYDSQIAIIYMRDNPKRNSCYPPDSYVAQ